MNPSPLSRVEVAVSDEVDDMRVVVEQPLAKRVDGWLRQPVDHDQPFSDLRRHGRLDARPLALDVELLADRPVS